MPDAIWIEQDGVTATIGDHHVATVELCRPPNNFFDVAMVRRIADLYDALAAERDVRVIVLCASGKHFCAGADFSGGSGATGGPGELYREAIRLFTAELPVVAAVQGAAIGGGLGLACSSDFRVAAPEARLAGDLTYGADILQRGQLPGVGRRRQLSQSTRQVLALEDQQPGLVVLPAHDPTAAQRLLDS
jgi:1,4-dihydroxy-2-naphthoyl-CoA synthase